MPKGNKRHLRNNGYGKSTNYITTGGAGYVPSVNIEDIKKSIKKKVYNYVTGGLPIDTVRNRLYRNLFQGYDPGIFNIKRNIDRIRKAVVDNKKEDSYYNKHRQASMDDLFAEYLQIPTNKRRSFYGRNYLEDSPYKPNISKDNIKYKRIVNGYSAGLSGLNPKDEERLVNAVMQGEHRGDIWGKTERNHGPVALNHATTSRVLSDYGLGIHTISRGYDNKGDYVSYYDLWDMAPTKHSGGNLDESMGIGKPIHIYNRLYLDDYYGVDDKDRGGYYLPEVVVTSKRKKHKDGGSIQIAPSKRGTFTAAATNHGMGVQEFASRVLSNKDNYSPAMVKKANFARNASKWK